MKEEKKILITQQSVFLAQMEARMAAYGGIFGLFQIHHGVKLSIVNQRSPIFWWLRFFVVLLHSDFKKVKNEK